ncbi:Protein BATH-7 [Aphelenchoides avenae]|nr:Protein BATH-7 [Aphelenchus avenae]
MKRANASLAGGPGEKRSNGGTTVPPPLYQPSQKFRLELVIQNVSELAGDGNDATYDVEGPVVAVGNSEWSLCAQVRTEDGSDCLDIRVSCQSPGAGWRLMMDYTARVIGRAMPKTERGLKICESGDDFCVFSKKKQVLLNPVNKYVTDGTLKMEVDVTIYEPYRMLVDFFTADSNYDADAVLRVQDRGFHVNKHYLGHESDYFRQLFFGPLADNSHGEVPLGGVDADEFLQFLGAIHRMRAPITEDNVQILLKLADRFQVIWLLGDCEQFLLKSEDFTTVEKLIICTKVKLDELQKECLDELTLSDVDALVDLDKESVAGTKLDGSLLQELLGKQKELIVEKMCTRCREKLS